MDKLLVLSILTVCLMKHEASGISLPGPQVYVVTPSPSPPQEQGRAAPFYYHNWMRRMDPPTNSTPTTTTTQRTYDTPDLIFAEFESGNRMKSIRKLLEKEKIKPVTTTTTTTTGSPIYNADDSSFESLDDQFGIPIRTNEKKEETTKKPTDMTDYFALYNNQYNPNSADLVPVYVAPTTSSTTTKTTTARIQDVQNIWNIIDSQKFDQYPGKWEEEPVASEDTEDSAENNPKKENSKSESQGSQELDDNFALPGFATNPGNGGENESRAIHTEHNMRFPYVNLKPFQMKTPKKPLMNTISNSKKGTGMLSLDNFHDLKNPVRGEAEDFVPARKPVDRYNPAQPYLPDYGTKSKQSSSSAPSKAVANLVPPPPPPPPRLTDDDFPEPDTYESFPPFGPVQPPPPPSNKQPPPPSSNEQPPPPSAPTPSILYQLPDDTSDEDSDDSGPPDSSSDSDGPTSIELEYKPPPPPPVQTYSAPAPMPYGGYSYDKPDVIADVPTEDEKVEYGGYHYDKPEPPPPPPPKYLPPPTYGYTPSYGHHHHYKPYGYYPTTTTTTTEMPRVNRYSYYYLGKKLYYLPLYFSVYFIVYVGALIIKAVLRHKIVYPNSWRPNDQTAGFFSKRSVDSWDLSNENLHEITGKVTHAIAVAGEKYFVPKNKK